jgi:[pyruvate, water dikinase]-phosphate phosphotransferase / [pyruvate, water dikinase] kinase
MKRRDEIKSIVIISDGTGKTARRLMDAVLSQYADQEVRYSVVKTYQEVRTRRQVDAILKEIKRDYLIIFSIISEDLRNYFHDKLERKSILHLNVLEPMLRTMSKFLGIHPEYRPGLLQIIDDRYYRKIDAIGYTVEHDDGLGSRHNEAELVLVGPSRCCKTPLSMYLACNFGLRVANIPLVNDPAITAAVLRLLAPVEKKSVCALIMQPVELARIRQERSEQLAHNLLGQRELQKYHDPGEVSKELRACRQLYQEQNWTTVDVTKRSIEEIAEEVLRSTQSPLSDISHRS